MKLATIKCTRVVRAAHTHTQTCSLKMVKWKQYQTANSVFNNNNAIRMCVHRFFSFPFQTSWFQHSAPNWSCSIIFQFYFMCGETYTWCYRVWTGFAWICRRNHNSNIKWQCVCVCLWCVCSPNLCDLCHFLCFSNVLTGGTVGGLKMSSH